MFVAAFPLAPLFALISGIVEIRVDAVNFIRDQRRPNPRMAEDIGAWYNILEALSAFSVTSDFIAKAVYYYSYSDDDNLKGYLNNSLSYYNTSLWKDFSRPSKQYDKTDIPEPHWCR